MCSSDLTEGVSVKISNQDGINLYSNSIITEGDILNVDLKVEDGYYINKCEINGMDFVDNTKIIVGSDISIICTTGKNILTSVMPELPNNFYLFPNPTNGIINIFSSDLIKLIYVYDEIGKLIRVIKGNEMTKMQVDLSDLNIGNYVITINENKSRIFIIK